MNRAIPAACLALAALAAPASAQSAGLPQNGIVYTVPATGPNGLTASCTIVADRWRADYGATTVYAVATAPNAIDTNVHCTVTKNGSTYVDAAANGSGYALINGEGHGTIPVAGIQVCVEADAQLTVDAHPQTPKTCINA